MSTPPFLDLVGMSRSNPMGFRTFSRDACLAAAKEHVTGGRAGLRERHRAGESGGAIVRRMTELADEVVLGVFDFALANVGRSDRIRENVTLLAQGGYGRCELNPFSDLDIGLLYPTLRRGLIENVTQFLVPFLWDLGWENSFVQRTVREAISLSHDDNRVYTGYLHARWLAGDEGLYGDLRLRLGELGPRDRPEAFSEIERLAAAGEQAGPREALYAREPNVKDGAGGLRDYHQALWLLAVHFGARTLEEATGQGLFSEDQLLEYSQALDFLWRVRNELHFQSGKREDNLTFRNEEAVAIALGYTTADVRDTARFMQDYYAAARTLQALRYSVGRAIRLRGRAKPVTPSSSGLEVAVVGGAIEAGLADSHWYEENPPRLMSVFWESARRGLPLSPATLEQISANTHLVGDTFRSNDLVRKFFLALCSRPETAGLALRQAARSGLLGRYLPEFAAVHGIVRYEDFHHYPVDEHTLQAIEALARVPAMEGAVGGFLKSSLEHLSDPYILVMALLLHDLGKAKGEEHTEEGMLLARQICQRIGLPEEDAERIAFLVKHHLLMTHIALYRDVDDADIVESFARTMKSEQRLRALLLMSYADLSAVGPGVWTEWKGALLLKLYLRTERVLSGLSETAGAAFWDHPKVAHIEEIAGEGLRGRVRDHVKDVGEHYLLAYSPTAIVRHIECLAEAEAKGLAFLIAPNEDTRTTDVVVCAPDHLGLFEEVTGCFVSQFVDVQEANLFTRGTGMALDCFRVSSASRGGALTEGETTQLTKVLTSVLSAEKPVESFIEQSRRRVFAIMHPPAPVRTDIRFDNQASRRFTVVDVMTGDRTGLLYDMSRALRERGVDISSARIVTDARRVRDSFYLSRDHHKLEDPAELAAIEDALRSAILGRPAAGVKGGAA
jgi:[protein-PII] uridylyltransferase